MEASVELIIKKKIGVIVVYVVSDYDSPMKANLRQY